MCNLRFHTNLDRYSFMNILYTLPSGSPIPRVGEMVKVAKRDDTPFDELAVVTVKYKYEKSRFSDIIETTVFVELHYSERQYAEAKAYDLKIF